MEVAHVEQRGRQRGISAIAMAMAVGLSFAFAWPATARADEPVPEEPTPEEAPAAEEDKAGPPVTSARLKRNRALERKLAADVSVAATTADADKRAAAEARLAEADYVSRYYALASHATHGRPPVRRYAWQGLAATRDPAAAVELAKALCLENDRALRLEVTHLLAGMGFEDTGLAFTPYLEEGRPARRFRALQAMGVFRHPRLARRLVQHMRLTLAGFPQAAVTITTQRAYIKGWQLVSGGTGLTVIEVPDPEVDVLETGVSMEVKVRQVEISMVVELLEDMTGQQGLGADPSAWERWLVDNPDFRMPER